MVSPEEQRRIIEFVLSGMPYEELTEEIDRIAKAHGYPTFWEFQQATFFNLPEISPDEPMQWYSSFGRAILNNPRRRRNPTFRTRRGTIIEVNAYLEDGRELRGWLEQEYLDDIKEAMREITHILTEQEGLTTDDLAGSEFELWLTEDGEPIYVQGVLADGETFVYDF
jgi:hypothetical protein